MKIIATLLTLAMLTGCTKQRLQKFNNRIVGDWDLVEVNRFGVGNANIVYDGGSFSFKSDNSLIYFDRSGMVYTGTWFIELIRHIDNDGDTDNLYLLTLNTANNKNIKFEQLEIPSFGNDTRFKGKAYNNFNTVTYVFERL